MVEAHFDPYTSEDLMVSVQFTGSVFEAQTEAPEGVTEALKAWLQEAGVNGDFTYRVIDRAKGTGTMPSVHAIRVRNDTFVNARVRPQGLGNGNSWMVAIPAPPGLLAGDLFDVLRKAEKRLSGDEEQLLTSRMATLYTYVDGQPIDISSLDPRIIASSGFKSREELEEQLHALHKKSKMVQRAGLGRFEWRDGLTRVQVTPLERAAANPSSETFVLSLTTDERALLFELAHVHGRIYDEKGDMQLRLPNELPLFDDELQEFFRKAEQFGLVRCIGDNPHGILGKTWGLNFPLLFVCVSHIGILFPDDISKLITLLPQSVHQLLKSGGVAAIPAGYFELIERAVRLVNQVHGKELIEIVERLHDPPIRVEVDDGVIAYRRTVTLRLPSDHALHLLNVQGLMNQGGGAPSQLAPPSANPVEPLKTLLREKLDQERSHLEHINQLTSTRRDMQQRAQQLKEEAAALIEQANALDAQAAAESNGLEMQLNAELEDLRGEIRSLRGQIQRYYEIGREEAVNRIDQFIGDYAADTGLDPQEIIAELRRRYSA